MVETKQKRSALWLAFRHVANRGGIVLLGVLAAVTGKPIPFLAAAAGLEAAWLTLATRPAIARRLFGDRVESKTGRAERELHDRRGTGLSEGDAARLARLEERRREILRLAEENRRFAGGLLHEEIDKLEDLINAFVDIAAAATRWDTYLKAVDFDDLESETRRHELDAERALDPGQKELARKNLAVLLQRRDQIADIRTKASHARSELDLVENSFKLLADQVQVMRNPKDIGGQLDDLLTGVEAVREMTRDDDCRLSGDGQSRARARAAAMERNG